MKYIVALTVLGVAVAGAVSLCGGATAKLLVKGKWRDQNTVTPGDLKGFVPAANVRLSRYGGLAARRFKATGFFHTRKINGRWWIIDPDGCLFITVGLCSVNQGTLDTGKVKQKFADTSAWARATGELLKSNGFNTLGSWSEWKEFNDKKIGRIPYTPNWNFMGIYKQWRKLANGQRGYPNECMPVFDPEFEEFCDRRARKLAATKDDPWLLGHFSDNELPFRPDSLSNYLELPASDTGHQAAKKWLAAHRKANRKRAGRISQSEQDAFLEHLARRYYTLVGNAIGKYDPNHMYIGSRIHGRTIRPPVFRASKALDIVSVNYYHHWSPKPERIEEWVRASGRPFIISEWYAMSVDSPDRDVTGAGFRVKTDRGRGLFYQNFTLGLLRSPGCVGWHWFKYGGDGKGFHKGVVRPDCTPHAELLGPMKQVNMQVYPLAAYFMRRSGNHAH